VESNAGAGIGFCDEDYKAVGADIVPTAADAWKHADMVVKVKEPIEKEFRFLRSDLTLFTYLHLAAVPRLAKVLCDSGCVSIAYETVADGRGRLPLLAPMSEVAGRLSTQVGAHFLQKAHGGSGVLLGGVTGVEPGNVTVIGGGISGINAAQMAVGLGAKVTILDNSPEQLGNLKTFFGSQLSTELSNIETIRAHTVTPLCVKKRERIPPPATPSIRRP